MSLIKWSKDYSVGIASIDEHHKIIIDYINELFAATERGEIEQVISRVLDGLLEYTEVHFVYEEDLFEMFGYQTSSEHHDEHQKFIVRLDRLIKDHKLGKVAIGMEVMDFLKQWLLNHILKSDMAYSQFLIEKGVK